MTETDDTVPNETKGRELVGLAVVLGLLAVVLGVFYNRWALPSEDAAMLMRYSEHLAAGHGIVWNIGEAPVDGATDFLFMLHIALMVKLGMGLHLATQFLVVGAHIGATGLIFWRTRRSGFSVAAATLAGGFFAVGPGLGYAEAYFGTSYFAFWAATSWFMAIEYVRPKGETSPKRDLKLALAVALASLGLGLARPDGVFMAGFVFAGIASQVPRDRAIRCFLAFAAVFGTLGIGYFVWRWNYFGHPLPNPFYKKGGFHLWFGSLATAIKTVIRFLLPILPLYLLALRRSGSTRLALFSAIPVAGFTGIWILLSDEMNYLGRFQYAVVPIAVMSAPMLLESVRKAWELPHYRQLEKRGRLVVAIGGLFAGILVPLALFKPALPSGVDGRAVIAQQLAAYNEYDYNLATTEAGLLPLLSTWDAVDTWGLNDAWIAHSEHGITEEYLEEQDPEVVLIHGAWSPVFQDERWGAVLGSKWDEMTDLLRDWCAENDYTLAAAWGASHTDTFQFWVKDDFEHSAEVIHIIQNAEFEFMGGPGPFVDFNQVSGWLELATPE